MEFLEHRNIVVCAKEAGQGSFLAALLRGRSLRGRVYAYAHAAPAFENISLPCTIVTAGNAPSAARILDEERPKAVLLGASTGWSLEKDLIVEARARRIPTYSFVDHYWNLWQRFAHAKTRERWHYMPTRIYVIDKYAKARIVALGCPRTRVRVYPHPGLAATGKEAPSIGKSAVFRRLRIPRGARTALFISETLFPVSRAWRWDQAKEADYVRLFTTMIKAASRVPNTVVLLKRHPAECIEWKQHLKGIDPALYRVVDKFDLVSLLDAVDVVFGLNSILLLHALERGRAVYTPRAGTLSRINPRVKTLGSQLDFLAVFESLRD